jgi:hypothetical protein
VRHALSQEPLLPRSVAGYVPAGAAKLARTAELRTLLTPSQLAELIGDTSELAWLSGEITADRTPALRAYLMHTLGITEITPETFVASLNEDFLQSQSDDWILKLYGFLLKQPALLRSGRLNQIPLIRLEDGAHVKPRVGNRSQAFLPTSSETDFPTVRRAVCAAVEAHTFLVELGITNWDPVDDVLENVLPRYREHGVLVDHQQYETDMRRLIAAFATDSTAKRDILTESLKAAYFVSSVDAGNGTKRRSRPETVYLGTKRLSELFDGVPGVLLVDCNHECLCGEEARALLKACGVAQSLRPIWVEPNHISGHLREMLEADGCMVSRAGSSLDDRDLQGLDEFLDRLPTLEPHARSARAKLLWEALDELESQRGISVFHGQCRWRYYGSHSREFEAAFVRRLNAEAWIPDSAGNLQAPEFVVFESLGWKSNPSLLSLIRFRPPRIEALAKEAGVEMGVLDLLRKLGVTKEADLLAILRDPTPPRRQSKPTSRPEPAPIGGEVVSLFSGDDGAIQPVRTHELQSSDEQVSGNSGDPRDESVSDGSGVARPSADNWLPRSDDAGNASRESKDTGEQSSAGGHAGGQRSGGHDRRRFVSYVAVEPSYDGADRDLLEQKARLELEAKAIQFISKREPGLRRPSGQPVGFDLIEVDQSGDAIRWIEVKAMAETLKDRPVGLSRAQFDFAREKGSNYWLYVVEHASDAVAARIVRIQDPAGRALTFTFDHGWIAVSDGSASAGGEPTARAE